MEILVFSFSHRRSVSTLFEEDISLCGDLTNSKSLQLFVCCQGEWVVSGWGRQRAKCLNTGLCCFDGCREEYSEVMAERNPHPPPHRTPNSYSQLSHNRECFRRQQSLNMTSEPSLREKKNQETEEQKKGRNERMKRDELPVKWVGRASTPEPQM